MYRSGDWKPQGKTVGWVDDGRIYLLRTVSYQIARKLADDTAIT